MMQFTTKLLPVYNPVQTEPTDFRGNVDEAGSASFFLGIGGDGKLVVVASSEPGSVTPVIQWDAIEGKPEFFPTTWKEVQQRPFYGPPPGSMVYYFGSAQVVLTGVYATDKAMILTLNGGITTAPFWRVCDGTDGTPDLRGLFLVGAGQGSGLTNRVFNATGGVETHPTTSADGGNPNYLSSASAVDNNMPPFRVAYPIIRTERTE